MSNYQKRGGTLVLKCVTEQTVRLLNVILGFQMASQESFMSTTADTAESPDAIAATRVSPTVCPVSQGSTDNVLAAENAAEWLKYLPEECVKSLVTEGLHRIL